MELAGLIEQYGYAAVFVGSVLEGETLLVLAGLAAHRGYLDIAWVVAIATTGGFFGDLICFYIGRRLGGRVLLRWPRLKPSVARVDRLLAHRGAVVVIGLRFMYGLRFAGLLAIGMSCMPWLRFARFNLLGALLWALTVAGAGYLLGSALGPLSKDLRIAEHLMFAAVIVVGVTLWVLGRRARRHTTRSR